MTTLSAFFARLFPVAVPALAQEGIAQQLMQRAEARAGQNPHQAQELRDAARAYLRVVR